MRDSNCQAPDVVGAYANRVLARLKKHNAPHTVAELCEALSLSDAVVRMGLDRLVFSKAVDVTYRHDPHRRGAMPRQYSAV